MMNAVFQTSVEYFLTPSFLIVYCSIIILVSVVSALVLNRKVKVIAGELREVEKHADLVAENGTLHKNIGESVGEQAVVNQIWRLYSTQLIPEDDRVGLNAKPFFSTQSAHDFFNEELYIESVINMSWFRAVPSALTGFGILGTFIGLAAGIQSADQFTREGIVPLLNGAGLAFITSICGLACSLWMTFFNRAKIFRAIQACMTTSNHLDAAFPVINRKNFDYLSLKQMQSCSESVEKIQKVLAAHHRNLEASLHKLFKDLISHFSRDFKQEVHQLGESFEDALNSASDRFERATQSFDESVKGMSSCFTESTEVIQKLSKTASTEMEVLGSDLNTKLRALVDDVRSTVDQCLENNHKNLKAVQNLSDELTKVAIRMTEHNNSVMQESQDVLVASAKQLRDTFVNEGTTLVLNLTSEYEQQGAQIATSLSKQLMDMSEAVAKRFDDLQTVARDLELKLQTVVTTESSSRQQFVEQIKVLQSVVASLEHVEKVVGPIKSVADSFEQIESAMQTSSKSNASAARMLTDVSENMLRSIDKLREGVNATMDEADHKLANIVGLLNRAVIAWNEDQNRNARNLLEAIEQTDRR